MVCIPLPTASVTIGVIRPASVATATDISIFSNALRDPFSKVTLTSGTC